jgi:putative oxidoreductase
MKHLPTIAGVLLGLMFIAFSAPVLLGVGPTPPPPPPGSPAEAFFSAFGKTGYLTFIKACELLGGIFVLIPRTRNLGLLILTPIVVNIVAYHAFITAGEGVFSPIILVIVALIVFLFYAERRAFLGLFARNR